MKAPHPIDRHVGAQLKARRLSVGMSQERLGAKLGLTFQQVQKYEKGLNRIGASRLFEISDALSVPVSFFFEGTPSLGSESALAADAPPETDRLRAAFGRITCAETRRRLVDLIEAMAEPRREAASSRRSKTA